jgi:predicted AAA+ superfamily ATPase
MTNMDELLIKALQSQKADYQLEQPQRGVSRDVPQELINAYSSSLIKLILGPLRAGKSKY